MTHKCRRTRKTSFKTQKQADRAKMRIWSHDPQADILDLHSYICPDCGCWHVGHKSYFLEVTKRTAASAEAKG